ncbi:hypothetical protein [Mucilaginibacter jinjuensis]|uniref:Uncharacterized protein n=1 Tax=Mucilaginibacter jinjuensis TaxID=1176721 RepID=A0ABY7TA21_9SPHI|nr:hypothetical protein [Mucilaginibacter jinjuensis]WCT13261.1 hypothetical protein PQO05_04865 [Mucilaginibacter jinjuensis]
MAEREKVNDFPRKGKPSGNGRESEGLNEAFAGTDPERENEIRSEYIDEATGEPADNVDVKHPNRHLHKGEDIACLKTVANKLNQHDDESSKNS